MSGYEIPKDVRNNPRCHAYTKLTIGGVIQFQATREPHPDDIPPVFNGKQLISEGFYFGEWVDTTEKARKEWAEKHKPSADTSEGAKRLNELEQAEALLKALKGE